MEEFPAIVNDGLISGNLGKTLVLTWAIGRCEECYIQLYFYRQHGGNILLFDVTKYQVSKSEFAQKNFGDRINVTWVGRSCKVELKHLKKNDTVNFNAQIFYLNGTRFRDISYYPSCISITDRKGMYIVFSKIYAL